MRGLTIIVATADAERFGAALTLAAAHAALGGRTRIYLHDAAVTCLDRSPMLDMAHDLGVVVIACQTGLAAHGVALPDAVEGGGMVAMLGDLGDDRLVTI